MPVHEVECQNCGETHIKDSDEGTMVGCFECCEHENTKSVLGGKRCVDCGTSL